MGELMEQLMRGGPRSFAVADYERLWDEAYARRVEDGQTWIARDQIPDGFNPWAIVYPNSRLGERPLVGVLDRMERDGREYLRGIGETSDRPMGGLFLRCTWVSAKGVDLRFGVVHHKQNLRVRIHATVVYTHTPADFDCLASDVCVTAGVQPSEIPRHLMHLVPPLYQISNGAWTTREFVERVCPELTIHMLPTWHPSDG